MASIPGGLLEDLDDDKVKDQTAVVQDSTPDRKESIPNNSDEPWKTALEIGKEYDRELVDGWKDELNNLLIFAGLFSAVVTAFVVASYPQLPASESTDDATVRLLTQISMQLASFQVTPTFVNSSAGTSTPPAAHHDHNTVTVNNLFFLSLTLSLISAFFAIAVQQWLRQVTIIPRHLSTQDAARLRQWRYDGLMTWQVPSIIAFLPLLIQIAVVLFLTGILVLLEPLDHDVASAFAAVAGTALLLFIFTALLPLVIVHCPYKSPFIPTTLAVLQWFAFPAVVAVLLVPTILFLAFALLLLGLLTVTCFNATVESWCDSMVDLFDTPFDKLGEFLFTLINPQTVGLQNFWTRRETDALTGDSDGPDLPVLSSAIAAASGTRAAKLRKAVETLSFQHRSLCVLLAVAIAVGFHSPGSDLVEDSEERHKLCRLITRASRAKHTLLHDDHANLMMEVLPNDWSNIDEDQVTLLILLLLHLATFVNRKPSPLLLRAAITARQNQDINTVQLSFERRAPTLLICLHAGNEDCAKELTDADVKDMLSSAEEILDTSGEFLSQQKETRDKHVHGAVEFILASTAAALMSFARQKGSNILRTDDTDVRPLLSSFDRFVNDQKDAILLTIKRFRRKREKSLLIVTPTAIKMICESLASLAKKQYLPLDGNCPSTTLVSRLYAICERQREDEYEQARDFLDEYKKSPSGPNPGESSGEPAPGSEQPVPTKDTSSDEDEKPALDSADGKDATEGMPELTLAGGSGREAGEKDLLN